ncbi:glycosyltransferase family 4 protein [Paraburkholderia diazotrophica]|uniref:Glycosyltransferase involved in cell wall bisynthesis n=1 Tax=Paraburkholderia diazotrophica TaxID=667676 RepID=A0A1H6QL95_9BURK|nr:glycosyltransferase family 4 protein [Paraburkholderia diazotrophica]SEI40907.1 Glycosyltransferase involved in cell wall bisynthesis [Paraburkholderia diazotrophica]
MRILIVTHVVAKNDGQGRVNYEIARAALAAGHAVTLLASNVAPELKTLARCVPVPEARVPTRLLRYQWFAWQTARWIRAHRDEFDIVHVNGFITWARADVNSVHFVHDGWYRSGYYPFRFWRGPHDAYQVAFTRLNALLEAHAFRRARVIVPVSGKVRGELQRRSVGKAQMQVIHNGVDIDEFAPGASERERLGLPSDAFMLLFAGDLRISRKNLDTVLRALVSMPAHVHLLVAGDTRDSAYPRMAEALGVAGRVHFAGFVKDMPALMRSVDAFVFPSRYEAMSLALLEALASALPVVTARTAGGAEVIGPHCGIVLDDPDDVTALTRAVAQLVDGHDRARQMGQAARELAKSLSWSAMAARYLSLYEHLGASREATPQPQAERVKCPAAAADS